jgi:hypothetical protein
VTDGRTPVDFRIYHPFDHDRSALGGVQYRAGFEDWSSQEVFVVQLEEAAGYDDDREAVDWSPIARFDHGRPHDVFSAADGLHLDLHQRHDPKDVYEHVHLGTHLRPRDPLAAFTRLQEVFRDDHNRAYLLDYYLRDLQRFNPAVLRL